MAATELLKDLAALEKMIATMVLRLMVMTKMMMPMMANTSFVMSYEHHE